LTRLVRFSPGSLQEEPVDPNVFFPIFIIGFALTSFLIGAVFALIAMSGRVEPTDVDGEAAH